VSCASLRCLPWCILSKTELNPHVQTRGDRRQAGRHVRDTIDDDHTIGAASDHAVAAPRVTKPGHGAQDAITRGEECGSYRLSLSSPDDGAIKSEFDAWSLGQITEDRVGSNASRPKIA
jgi:hypothetical protein